MIKYPDKTTHLSFQFLWQNTITEATYRRKTLSGAWEGESMAMMVERWEASAPTCTHQHVHTTYTWVKRNTERCYLKLSSFSIGERSIPNVIGAGSSRKPFQSLVLNGWTKQTSASDVMWQESHSHWEEGQRGPVVPKSIFGTLALASVSNRKREAEWWSSPGKSEFLPITGPCLSLF